MSVGAHVPKLGEIARYLSLHSPTTPGRVTKGLVITPVSLIPTISGLQYRLTSACVLETATPVGKGSLAKNVRLAA
jgi:hypothetical protein